MFNTDFDWLGVYSKQIHDVLTSAHNHGYAEGFDRAKREYDVLPGQMDFDEVMNDG